MFGGVSTCSPVPTASAHHTGVYSTSAWGHWQLLLVTSDRLIPRAFQDESLKDFTLLTEFMRKMQRKKWKLRSIWREGDKLCFPWKPASLPTGYCCWAGMGMKSLTWGTAGFECKSVQFSLQSCLGIFDQITDQTPWNWGEFHHWRDGMRSVWAGFDTSADAVYSVNSLSCSGRGTLWEIMHTKNSSLEVQPEGFPVIWIPMQKYSTWRKHMEEKQLFENLNSIN